ncbi:hypothetical protein [Acaryochloris marina]|uniref:hypothetical protein n=1 Tax=Acaryochloris marina TaxID=155978 RepID=UPI001BAFCAA7|nr:hypothetical protein [Acaryochloris marina]QUY45923.1 hypothetical protein I1H34_28450 [Acaryochloris marina S15]
MNPQIISLNSKPTPQTTPEQPKPAPSTPKLLDKTEFPTKSLAHILEATLDVP